MLVCWIAAIGYGGRMRVYLLMGGIILLLAACGGGSFNTRNAKGYYASEGQQCVPYAREVSGIQIRGDAYTWWNQVSDSRKSRMPRRGAVMVLAKTRRLSLGHLAVVKRVLNRNEIEVTHTNWGSDSSERRIVYEAMRVKDVSAVGDWSSAVFWNPHTNAYGSPYKVSGFILP